MIILQSSPSVASIESTSPSEQMGKISLKEKISLFQKGVINIFPHLLFMLSWKQQKIDSKFSVDTSIQLPVY